MANIVYGPWHAVAYAGGINVTSDVIRVLLERSTSSYSPNKDHDFLDDFTGGGGVEISVASYARQTAGSVTVTYDATNNRVEIDMADISFGTLESGQTVKAIIVYKQVGGDDTTPANDNLIAYIDTDSGGLLPVALSDGAFSITINAEGLIQLS